MVPPVLPDVACMACELLPFVIFHPEGKDQLYVVEAGSFITDIVMLVIPEQTVSGAVITEGVAGAVFSATVKGAAVTEQVPLLTVSE